MKFLAKRGHLSWLLMALLCVGAMPAQEGVGEPPKGAKNQVPPKALKQERPQYPNNLSRLGLRGSVKVEFVITQEGAVHNPVVVQSNNPWFERAAIDSILKWKFSPATVDGKNVNTKAVQEIIFDLWGGGDTPWALTNVKAKKLLPPEMQWDIAPVPVNTAYPVYPFEALQAGLKGKTKIAYFIGANGGVVQAKLLEATTPEMGQAVLAMIDTWRFEPARKKDGTPILAAFSMEHEFSPSGSGGVPVSEGARNILQDLQRRPKSFVALKDLDQPLKPLSRRPPVYPLAQDGNPGSATIEFFVDRNGDAQLPHILSSTATEFGYAAVQAAATWRFEVPRKGGKPAVARAQITIEFSPQPAKPATPTP